MKIIYGTPGTSTREQCIDMDVRDDSIKHHRAFIQHYVRLVQKTSDTKPVLAAQYKRDIERHSHALAQFKKDRSVIWVVTHD